MLRSAHIFYQYAPYNRNVYNDFMTYNSGDWTVTTTEAGTGSASEAITSGAGGQLLLTNAAGDNDLDFLQLKGESFKLSTSKRAYFSARFSINKLSSTLETEKIAWSDSPYCWNVKFPLLSCMTLLYIGMAIFLTYSWILACSNDVQPLLDKARLIDFPAVIFWVLKSFLLSKSWTEYPFFN